jgi:hypothetical protein
MDADKPWSAVVSATVLMALFIIVSSFDYAEALTTEAILKDRPFPAWMVIPYVAVVCDTSNSRKKPACCYYVPSSEYPRTSKTCKAQQR